MIFVIVYGDEIKLGEIWVVEKSLFWIFGVIVGYFGLKRWLAINFLDAKRKGLWYYLGGSEKEINKKQLLIISGIVAGIILVLFLSIVVVPKVLVTLTRATASEKVVVVNSYLIGQKILAKADGKDKCVVKCIFVG